MARLRHWLRSVVFRRRLEREMQAEMAEHLERSTERLIARGLSREQARRKAIREFGNVVYLQEEGRIARGTAGLDTLMGDLRFALRHFARHPLSTLTIIAVLSVGIGINVVLFSLVYSFTGRPPSGIESSDALVRIRGSQLGLSERIERAFTIEEVQAYAGLEDQFSAVGAWTSQPVTAASPGSEETTVTATFVTGDYFDVLGLRPALGSGLVKGEAGQVAVLSHSAWMRSFGGDPRVLGGSITLNDVPFTIVGVAPSLFRGAAWEARDDMQLWVPLAAYRRVLPGVLDDVELFRAIARLRPGSTRESAGGAVEVVAGRVLAERARDPGRAASPLGRDPSAEVVPLLADNLEPEFEARARFVKLAFGVLGLLTLLVTCANVSSLQTGLALARRREVAIRISLGAQRVRVIRQLVTESLLLATLAAVAAIGVTFAMIRVILGIVGTFSFELVFDRATVVFTFGVALAAGLLFGLSPALHATRIAVAGALKDSAGSIAGGRARLQRGLVVAQIAFTQPLAVCVATMVVFGIIEYRKNPPEPYGDRIVLLQLASAGAWKSELTGDVAARERRESDRLVEALRQVPGVTNAMWHSNQAPFSRAAFTLPEAARTGPDDGEPFYVSARTVTPGYLDLMGVPILLGRDLEPTDSAASRAGPTPAIVGDDMARSVWGNGNPIGRRVERVSDSEDPMTLEVIGVYEQAVDAVGHSRDNFTVFLPPDPSAAALSMGGTIMLRTSSAAETVLPTIRQVVRDEAPRAAITELRTLAAAEDQERFVLWGGIVLFSTGGLVVLLLSAIGLYALIAFAVGQRTREVAVRMAMGARARQIVHGFAFDGLRLTALGIALGLPLSVLGLKALLSLKADVPDVSLVLVTAIVALGVLGVSWLASWIPAIRAAGIDPASVLRRE